MIWPSEGSHSIYIFSKKSLKVDIIGQVIKLYVFLKKSLILVVFIFQFMNGFLKIKKKIVKVQDLYWKSAKEASSNLYMLTNNSDKSAVIAINIIKLKKVYLMSLNKIHDTLSNFLVLLFKKVLIFFLFKLFFTGLISFYSISQCFVLFQNCSH